MPLRKNFLKRFAKVFQIKISRKGDWLGKILSGKAYGICVACEKPIAEARLEAMPETPLCVNCSR